ncbi:MAG: imidazole glycerol phosphate synthase subunit HisH [Candidatus Alkanophagales archaeon]|nr:MAG: imidazole glycerol phosphate synthase subunit HisH [Candidatus Alkanophagales archaeon]
MIAIIDYKMGNLFSIYNGIKKAGGEPVLVDGSAVARLREADGIVIPGVGAFGDGVKNFKVFEDVFFEMLRSGTPVLGICLGMQMFFESSEESGGHGLSVLKGSVVRLPSDVTTPHMGWNSLRILKETPILGGIKDGDYFYFVHSYHCIPEDARCVVAVTDYGGTVVAVIQEKNVYATQFHPEKSGRKGLRVLENFVRVCRS